MVQYLIVKTHVPFFHQYLPIININQARIQQEPGFHSNMTISSYQYRIIKHANKIILQVYYLQNGTTLYMSIYSEWTRNWFMAVPVDTMIINIVEPLLLIYLNSD